MSHFYEFSARIPLIISTEVSPVIQEISVSFLLKFLPEFLHEFLPRNFTKVFAVFTRDFPRSIFRNFSQNISSPGMFLKVFRIYLGLYIEIFSDMLFRVSVEAIATFP